MSAVLQFTAVVAWYTVKSEEQGLKLDLLEVTWLQWGAFFALVFLGQVTDELFASSAGLTTPPPPHTPLHTFQWMPSSQHRPAILSSFTSMESCGTNQA